MTVPTMVREHPAFATGCNMSGRPAFVDEHLEVVEAIKHPSSNLNLARPDPL
nr:MULTISPECIES: hypothetical protein [Brevundimonas]